MKTDYWHSIINYFTQMTIKDIDERTLHQVKRCLLDFLGCSIYASSHRCAEGLVDVILSNAKPGPTTVWSGSRGLDPKDAAFLNACRTSNIELDDVSGIGASVHPGVYVWSTALAAYEESNCSIEDFICAILFGYDVCMRMGLLSSEKVREFGLHGPGLNGGLGAAVTCGRMKGYSREQLENAFSITATLLPACPFISFMEGTDSKDLYGGWGVYLGMYAAEFAARGLTGPTNVIDGEKSMGFLYNDEKGKDVPLGSHYYINNIAFKEFSACASVHPAVSSVLLINEKYQFSPEEIETIKVYTYPYSFVLNSNVAEELNVSSARLSLPFTVAVALIENGLPPRAFEKQQLTNEVYTKIAQKVQVFNNTEYGDGPYAIRGAIVEITLANGEILRMESLGSRWSPKTETEALVPSDKALVEKFNRLTQDSISSAQATSLLDNIWDLDKLASLQPIIEVLSSVNN
jgi:2-methylcitrate dehydratase PrpD